MDIQVIGIFKRLLCFSLPGSCFSGKRLFSSQSTELFFSIFCLTTLNACMRGPKITFGSMELLGKNEMPQTPFWEKKPVSFLMKSQELKGDGSLSKSKALFCFALCYLLCFKYGGVSNYFTL